MPPIFGSPPPPPQNPLLLLISWKSHFINHRFLVEEIIEADLYKLCRNYVVITKIDNFV